MDTGSIDLSKMSPEELIKFAQACEESAKAAAKRADALQKSEKERVEALQADFDYLNHKYSVKELLKAMPRMQESEANKPSIITNEAAQAQVEKFRADLAKYKKDYANWRKYKGKSSSLKKKHKAQYKPSAPTRPPFHEPAEIVRRQLDGFNFDVHMQNGKELIKSSLHQEMETVFTRVDGHGRRILSHHNETSPGDYLVFVLEDAIRCCGLAGRLTVVKEATLFSLRPDLVTVLVDGGRLLLALEVRNPGRDVFDAETAAGQVLDCLKALMQNGVDWPFVLLSTYNQSVIAFGTHDSEKYREILRAGSTNATLKPPIRHAGGHYEPMKKAKPPTSPGNPSHHQHLKSIPPSEDPEDPEEEEDKQGGSVSNAGSVGYDYKGRKVCFSQIYDVDSLFKAVTLLLESSLVAYEESQQRSNPLLPEKGASLEDNELCTLYANGFSYEKVSIGQVTYNRAPQISRMLKYHVLCQLGQGRSGKTILCSSSSGVLFAVKLYFMKASTGVFKDDRREEEKRYQYKKDKEKEAKKEWQRWMQLGEPQYKAFCHVVELNGLPALTMPYFATVPLQQRKDALGLIEKRLQEIAKQGLYYNGSDLRWQHFGYRWTNAKMEITLLDLGSLGNNKENVAKQVEELRERMGIAEEGRPKPVFVKRS